MKALPGVLFVLLLAGCCAAQRQEEPEWQRKAENSHGGECVKACLQAAHVTLEDANKLFSSGDTTGALARITDTVAYVKRSVDCSVQSHKDLKQAEILLRGLIRRAHDIEHSLDYDDRPPVVKAIAEMEQQRDRLLHALFGAAAGGPAEKKP
jgi:hypothetical protein